MFKIGDEVRTTDQFNSHCISEPIERGIIESFKQVNGFDIAIVKIPRKHKRRSINLKGLELINR